MKLYCIDMVILFWIVARYVFLVYCPFRPQSGHIRPCGISPIRPYPPGKMAVFPRFSTFFQIRTIKKVLTAHRGAIYQIKASKIPFKTQRNLFRFDKYMCVGMTFDVDSCSKFWGNLEGIRGNPGEIPHIGWKIPGVYRDHNQRLNPTSFQLSVCIDCFIPIHTHLILYIAF